MSKVQRLIVALLHRLTRPAERTRLVKLVYFVDYIYYGHTGRTYSGLNYMWDHYGPNAVSNAIILEANKLVDSGQLGLRESMTYYGDPQYLYFLEPTGTYTEEHLEPLAKRIVEDVAEKYGTMALKKLVNASKDTKPFKDALQYSVLVMDIDEDFQKLKHELHGSQEVEKAKRNLEAKSESGEGLEEVKARYRL